MNKEGWGITIFSDEAHYFVYGQSLCETYGTETLTRSYGDKRCSLCEYEHDKALIALANKVSR